MKYLLILLFPAFCWGQEINLGMVQGHHIISKGLNDTHPYLGVDYKDFGIMGFINSFEKLSVAPHYKFATKVTNVNLIARVGLTTGYGEYNVYNGKMYKLSGTIFLTNDLMFMIVPEARIDVNKNAYVNTLILGESVSVGMGMRF